MLILFMIILIEQRTAVLILARGGSKEIRLKNLRKLEGTSLLTRAIHTVKLAGLDDITVSTDHHLIALESLLSGGVKIFHRSQVTATDWAPSIWGASEFISHRPDVDILVLIQVTSPLLHSKSLRAGVEVINYPRPRDCVFSVKRSHNLRWLKLSDNIRPKNFKLNNRPRRQDWDGEFIETGAFYISRRHLIENGYFQNNNCTIVEVSPEESLEVDSYYDLQVAKALLNNNLI